MIINLKVALKVQVDFSERDGLITRFVAQADIFIVAVTRRSRRKKNILLAPQSNAAP